MLAVWVTLQKFHSYGREFNLESTGWNIWQYMKFPRKTNGGICNWSVNSDKQLLPFLPAIKPIPLDNSIQPSKKQLLAVTRIKRDLPLKSSFFFFFKPSSLILSECQESPGAVCLQTGPKQTLLSTWILVPQNHPWPRHQLNNGNLPVCHCKVTWFSC